MCFDSLLQDLGGLGGFRAGGSLSLLMMQSGTMLIGSMSSDARPRRRR